MEREFVNAMVPVPVKLKLHGTCSTVLYIDSNTMQYYFITNSLLLQESSCEVNVEFIF